MDNSKEGICKQIEAGPYPPLDDKELIRIRQKAIDRLCKFRLLDEDCEYDQYCLAALIDEVIKLRAAESSK